MKKVYLLIKGKVQGVFFRENVRKIAKEFGIKGYVKNTINGDVEVAAYGKDEKIRKLIKYCKKGPKNAIVEDVEIKKLDNKEEFEEFEIKY